ncbi:hypothetical protein FHR22_000874 [Sphingopyxis panaciterrae]|uniref:hypothetical protein n=1 Tax=Sphingopyxis panaciterrae TaxID=363841 RepID=UPI00142189CC|nr:hypothetical protein [Sphingopyxis panaciterrae]NIJ36225.1 hypothetical protein [Sphingopyxis panaciterrae]
MNIFKKAAVALAATSMALAPVVASAAPAAAFDGARATSTVDGQSEFEGSTWLYALIALAAVVGVVLLVDKDSDPVSA